MNYNEEFERLNASKKTYVNKPGWGRFISTNKGDIEKDTGFVRYLYDNHNRTIRKQLVYGSDNNYKILDVEVDMYGDNEEVSFYPMSFESVDHAIEILRKFTVESMDGEEFDRIAYQTYLSLLDRDISKVDALSFVSQYQMYGSLDSSMRSPILQDAVEYFGL